VLKRYIERNKNNTNKIRFFYIAAIVSFENLYCPGFVTCHMKGSEPPIFIIALVYPHTLLLVYKYGIVLVLLLFRTINDIIRAIKLTLNNCTCNRSWAREEQQLRSSKMLSITPESGVTPNSQRNVPLHSMSLICIPIRRRCPSFSILCFVNERARQ
jgi:hypothetical protein